MLKTSLILIFFLTSKIFSKTPFFFFLENEFRIFRFVEPPENLSIKGDFLTDEKETAEISLTKPIDLRKFCNKDEKAFLFILHKKKCLHVVSNLNHKEYFQLSTKPEYQQLLLKYEQKDKKGAFLLQFTCQCHRGSETTWTVWHDYPLVNLTTKDTCFFEFVILKWFSTHRIFSIFLFICFGVSLGFFGSLWLQTKPWGFKLTLLIVIALYIVLLMNELNFERPDLTLAIFMSFLLVMLVFSNLMMFDKGLLASLCILKSNLGCIFQHSLFVSFVIR